MVLASWVGSGSLIVDVLLSGTAERRAGSTTLSLTEANPREKRAGRTAAARRVRTGQLGAARVVKGIHTRPCRSQTTESACAGHCGWSRGQRVRWLGDLDVFAFIYYRGSLNLVASATERSQSRTGLNQHRFRAFPVTLPFQHYDITSPATMLLSILKVLNDISCPIALLLKSVNLHICLAFSTRPSVGA